MAAKQGQLALVCGVLGACSDNLQIEVSVVDATEVASVEVIDARIYSGELENDEGISEQLEDATLPVTFSVPPGEYVVIAAQGTCNDQETVTLEDKDLTVALSLLCVE